MIEKIINDILIAKDNRAYLSALSLSLTLPSILSSIDINQKSTRKDYVAWFDQWVYKYYEQPKSDNEIINKGIEATKFDGENCYALRCSLLHAGNTDLIESKGKIGYFVLCASDKSSHEGDASVCSVSCDSASDIYVSLNVVGLIDAIVSGAREYLAESGDKIQNYLNNRKSRLPYGSIDIELR